MSGCPSTCTGPSDCVPGYYWSPEFACLPRKTNGSPCVSDGECLSICSEKDGVCCATECPGARYSCLTNYTGQPSGNCHEATNGIDPYCICAPLVCLAGACG